MAILEKALAKLTLKAFRDREHSKSGFIGELTAMYNPESVELSYAAEYEPVTYLGGPLQENEYKMLLPGDLSLELILDARLSGKQQTVDGQLSKLRAMCFPVSGNNSNEPHFLKIEWGQMKWLGHGHFAGRATKFAINYTLFDRDATPLRATVNLTLQAGESLAIQKTKSEASSYTMIKAPARGSLPLLAAASVNLAAGRLIDYLSLAYDNDLDHFNAIKPGQQLKCGSGKV